MHAAVLSLSICAYSVYKLLIIHIRLALLQPKMNSKQLGIVE